MSRSLDLPLFAPVTTETLDIIIASAMPDTQDAAARRTSGRVGAAKRRNPMENRDVLPVPGFPQMPRTQIQGVPYVIAALCIRGDCSCFISKSVSWLILPTVRTRVDRTKLLRPPSPARCYRVAPAWEVCLYLSSEGSAEHRDQNSLSTRIFGVSTEYWCSL